MGLFQLRLRIQVSSVLLRSLPSVTPKEYAWWENVDFVATQLLHAVDSQGDEIALNSRADARDDA